MIESSPHFSLIYTDLVNLDQLVANTRRNSNWNSALNSEITIYIYTYILLADTQAKPSLVYTRHYAPRSTLEPRHPRKRAEAKEVCLRSLYVTASNSAFGTRGLEASLVPSVYICTGSRGFCVSVSEVTYAAATWQCGRSRPIDASRATRAACKLAFHGAQISRAGI